MENERVTRRALARVFFLLTANAPLAFGPVERKLLAQFLRGGITLDQALWLVEERIQNAQAIEQLRQLTTSAVYLQA